jgi:hypothetical protein
LGFHRLPLVFIVAGLGEKSKISGKKRLKPGRPHGRAQIRGLLLRVYYYYSLAPIPSPRGFAVFLDFKF